MLRYNLGQDPFKYAAPSTNMSVSVEIGQTDDFTISAEGEDISFNVRCLVF